MKRFITSAVVLLTLLSLCLAACSPASTPTSTIEAPATSTAEATQTKESSSPLWENAIYTEDKELGQGNKTITVIVEADGKTVRFTINTDAEYLGTALTENGIVEGTMGDYGLMVEKVNGISAVYAKDGAYWALYSKGEYAMKGADTTLISDGDQYEWIYTKA